MILLIIAGISLTASAVSWWNGCRTAEVQQRIDQLEDELAQVRVADAAGRRRLTGKYLERLDELIEEELATRDAIATELAAGRAKAHAILRQRFGSSERNSFLRVVFELELALSRVESERAYLRLLAETVSRAASGDPAELPGPAALQLPNHFPCEGGIVSFDGRAPSQWHGYRLNVDDWSDDVEGRAMLFAVDHGKRTARVSTTGVGLLEANLLDGGGAIAAKVVGRDREGIHLQHVDARLLLPCRGPLDYPWLAPESIIEVYAEVWTLQEVIGRGRDEPLRVRLQRRVEGSRRHWSPILLSVNEDQLSLLVEAYERISDGALQDVPWRVHLRGSGQVAFSLGSVTLVTTACAERKAFALEDISFGEPRPELSIRFHAALTAFVPGTDDDAEADRSLFTSFVEAIHAELSSQKHMLLQRRAALRLRKLSLIYQDQREHLQATGTCAFLAGEVHRGGRVIIGTIAEQEVPAWLDDALSAGGDARLRAVGLESSWDVADASWVDRHLGTCRIQLDVPKEATHGELNPFGLTRLELAGEGAQQQALSRALENAILGKFASAAVHESLLGLSGAPLPNQHLGREAVERVLSSDSSVVAIWGPPGTGKTTLLVSWLLSLFDPGKQASWPSVLITAPTHVAITKLVTDLLVRAGRLSKEIVRYGSAQKVLGSGLEPVWHQRLLEGLNQHPGDEPRESQSGQRWDALLETREGREAAAKWILGPRHIHVATCVGMMRKDYALASRTFDIAIIDEAGKAFGAELLVPASVARRVVLVGDHNQLPPTITTDMLDEDIGYRLSMREVEELLRRSMFREIFEQLPPDNKGMLTLQHRMHQDIGDLVGELFYKGRLESDRRECGWTLTSRRLVFVDFTKVQSYRHRKSRHSKSIENPTERDALRILLQRLAVRAKDRRYSVLIVCPYEAQRTAVELEIGNTRFALELRTTTVDAVQGGEADVVILMMTRSGGRVEFLLDRHRLNVALSRARDAVVVLGHLGCLARDGHGPVAEFIRFGVERNTLDIVELPARANFEDHLGPRVIP